jgi:hypothetical protein
MPFQTTQLCKTGSRICARTIAAALAALLSLHSGDASAQQQTSSPKSPAGFRKLAPGVETTIPIVPDEEDTVTNHDMVEIQSAGAKIDWKPETQSQSTTLAALTKDIPFRRPCWYLEFTFKPLRMIDVDMPRPDGRMERRQIWYLVYHVKNMGDHLEADPEGGKNVKLEANKPTTQDIFFRPQFVLESPESNKAYLDRVLPLAVEAIQKREDPNRKLLNTVQIAEHPIPLSTADEDHSVWGVATWEYIDPNIDFFSIYVKGLTNAYRFGDPAGAFKQGDPAGKGRVYVQKTLKLNFWRPGDKYDPNEDELYYGRSKKVDHEWVFR